MLYRQSALHDAEAAKQRAVEDSEKSRLDIQLELTDLQAKFKEKERALQAAQDELAVGQGANTGLERALREARTSVTALEAQVAAQNEAAAKHTVQFKALKAEKKVRQSDQGSTEQAMKGC